MIPRALARMAHEPGRWWTADELAVLEEQDPSALREVLARCQREGWADYRWERSPQGRKRKVWRITADGIDAAADPDKTAKPACTTAAHKGALITPEDWLKLPPPRLRARLAQEPIDLLRRVNAWGMGE